MIVIRSLFWPVLLLRKEGLAERNDARRGCRMSEGEKERQRME